jgi:hypothetical protein
VNGGAQGVRRRRLLTVTAGGGSVRWSSGEELQVLCPAVGKTVSEIADKGESARVEKKIEGGSVPSPRSSTAAEIRRDRNGVRVNLARFFLQKRTGKAVGVFKEGFRGVGVTNSERNRRDFRGEVSDGDELVLVTDSWQ